MDERFNQRFNNARRSVVLLTWVMLALVAHAEPGDIPRYYFWVKDVRHELQLDTSVVLFIREADVIAMRGADDPAAVWSELKKNHPEPPQRLAKLTSNLKADDPSRMWIASLSREHGPNDMEQLVADLAADDSVAFAAPIFKTDLGPTLMMPHIVARYQAGLSHDQVKDAISRTVAGAMIDWEHLGMPRVVKIQSATKNGFELLHVTNLLHGLPEFEFAEPSWIVSGKSMGIVIPNDPGFGLQWGLHNTGQSGGFNDVDINGPEAWDLPVTSRGVTVLVLDDGVQRNHPDLNYDIRFGRNFTVDPPADGGGPVTPNDRHGTAVAGVIAARSNNMLGVAGTAPGSFVASAKCYEPDAAGGFAVDAAAIAQGILYSIAVGAQVTNSSFVLGSESNIISAAYEDTWQQGVIHFAASGNDDAFFVRYPASHPFVIAVGAIDRTGLRADFSNRGFDLELVAPGVDILTTDRTGSAGYNSGPNPDYAFTDGFGVDGTSYASPCAAGVAALLLRRNPRLTPAEVRQRLRETALDISPQVYGVGFDESTDWGLVRAAAALSATPGPRIGDADGNGAVNFDDITAVLAHWDTDSLDGDANYDGRVDFDDVTAVLANWDQ
ncbi:MAG TPA: hypothetical protein DEB06_07000 [Phycisphaerales bacterium]|nr:hypothetical protein [Phycisphaerales bacterium]